MFTERLCRVACGEMTGLARVKKPSFSEKLGFFVPWFSDAFCLRLPQYKWQDEGDNHLLNHGQRAKD